MGENENNITIHEVISEIRKNRTEIKNAIEALESRLLIQIADLKKKNNTLEQENQILKKEIEQIKINSNENSIVVFGLHTSVNKLTIQDICLRIFSLVEVEIKPSAINNYYTLGNKYNSPLKIDLVNHWMRRDILKNCFKLKEKKGISIAPVLTKKQQQESKILRQNLFLAKQQNKENSYIKNGKLYVNNQPYTIEDLIDAEEVSTDRLSNSAPSTPKLETDTRVENNPLPGNTEKPKFKPEEKSDLNTTPSSSKNTSKPNTRFQDNKKRNNSTSTSHSIIKK
ncbi:uncharacterized protein LOC126893246 [Diabrotica virgifera virgifera]|uniref:Uncharacterized protein n=1 Tax=Diabrotica virgifera virgifera TaxID=50390 RepID=A0ABM5L9S1_DIAVI|nr:uncharacterized protein LOC126893246 [Diabrotica virgifera virgifera]